MEDSPGFKSRLREHLTLDFAVDVSHVLLNVEGVWTATSCGTHKEFTGCVLESIEFLRVLVELQVPELLLLNTSLVGLEVVHEVFNLLNLGLGVGVENHSEIFHQTEVSTHGISKASELT